MAAMALGNLWRISGDALSWHSILLAIDTAAPLAQYAGPGEAPLRGHASAAIHVGLHDHRRPPRRTFSHPRVSAAHSPFTPRRLE